MIIGLTGKNGSGKGEVAKFLAERGFVSLSLSDVLREEAGRLGKGVTRELLVELGNRLRKEFGSGVLAERVFARLDPEKNYVVDSIRHPAEVQVFRRRRDFFLVNLHAPQRLRFGRLRQRGRENDPRTYEEFQALETKEASSPDSSDQQLDRAISSADVTFENGGALRDLHEQLKRFLLDSSRKTLRPDWDEYFMGIAKMVALRSNCIKRKVAAVLVKDRRIISTGYNGTPRGVKNCNEGGCPRCNNLSVSGKDLEECLCSHAEENAITQAAYHGVNIKESTLYTTYSPCLICTKMIINAGIREVVYSVEYELAERARALLEEGGVLVRQINIPQPLPSGVE